MRSGLERLVAGARQAGIYRRCGRLGVLLLGLMVSACANIGQIGNLTDVPHISVAFESIDGPPAAVHDKFMRALKDEASARQIAVVGTEQANYRLRGYLATHSEGGATSLAWAWDVYDSSQRRAFRLKGEDKVNSTAGWAAADEATLHRIARNGLDQIAGFAAQPRQASAVAEPAPTPEKRAATVAWLDDWAPEAAGIFRIFRREEARAETASGPNLAHAAAVPMPLSRPAPEEVSARALAFAPEHH